jgi:high-affinity iron transporter
MEAVLIIAFREGLEAFLVLGIILAFLEKTGLHSSKKYAWGGLIAGITASLGLAVIFTVVVDGFESEDLQYIISLAVLLLAIVLLTYMVFWMQHNSEISNMKQKIELSNNQKWITFLIVFTAILREGLETVLFVLALMMDAESTPEDVLTGLSVGLSVSAIAIWILFKSSIQLPLKKFFQYSSYLILLIVAGLVGLFIKGMQAYEYLPTIKAPLYDSSFLLSNESIIGKVLGILIGYDATPSLLQFMGWSGYILLIVFLLKRGNHLKNR